jgi:hypothetical protein
MSEKCAICKHIKEIHAVTLVDSVGFCAECLTRCYSTNPPSEKFQFRHEFKLDNLQLIEDLAAERKLL